MSVDKTQPVNFEVLEIAPGDKKGFVKISARFFNSEKVYDYYRKVKSDGLYNYGIISGCRVTFSKFTNDDGKYTFKNITREYDTKGGYRQSTESITREHRVTPNVDDFILLGSEDVEDTTEEQDEVEFEIVEEVKEIKPKEEVIKLPKKIRHEEYDTICKCLDAGIAVYLYGPAGSGKNYTLEQIARERGWNFYFTNSVQQEYKLSGFIDAGGRYHETEFYRACTDDEECMFFLDELDASISEVLVLLNAAIANGYFEFPTGKVTLDLSKIHIVAAGNTAGSGADDMYTGRSVIDASTMDRFVSIPFSYYEPIELKITKGNKELVDFIHDIRKVSENLGIRAVFSYRCMIMTMKLEETGMALDKIMQIAIMKGLDKDTVRTIHVFGTNKYYQALKRYQM